MTKTINRLDDVKTIYIDQCTLRFSRFPTVALFLNILFILYKFLFLLSVNQNSSIRLIYLFDLMLENDKEQLLSCSTPIGQLFLLAQQYKPYAYQKPSFQLMCH